ncbi:MlaD family protein [Bdellovibrio sp. HCB185ZH]|uniref:MlaD family protein n=1 Tax=Bdellovibrio sp. HCB185ZH TaxID=3394235 RepID=UPI0039A5684F
MMNVKFNKFERIAGLFVGLAILGVIVTAISIAIKQGWFDSKVFYTTTFENADGLHQGTTVQMAGLRAGAVEDVELRADNKIQVTFYVLSKFQERIRQDSSVSMNRPFIIGEKILEVTVGSEKLPILASNSPIGSHETMDVVTMLSSRNISTTMSRVGGLLENMQMLVEAFADKNRAQSFVRVIDRMDPLMKNMTVMSQEVIKLSKQATKNDSMEVLMTNLATTTTEINRILPELNKQNPELAKDLAVMTQNLAVMTHALGPVMKEVEPELPQASRRLLEVMNETVVTLKAMQKSFFMESNVREVRKEEALQRAPASDKAK